MTGPGATHARLHLPAPAQETRLYLIRHGQTDWNAEERYQGQIDSTLSARGRDQAARLARTLASVPLRAVYTSPLSRARDTATVIAAPHGLAVITLETLREVNMGEWEGLTAPEITDRFGDVLRARRRDPQGVTPAGGEALADLQARALGAVACMVGRHPGATIAAVAHGGLNKTILLAVLGAPLSRYWAIRQDNAAINLVVFGETGARVELLNETSYLEAAAARRPGIEGTPAAPAACTRRPQSE